jgi:DNA-binding NarL/FixJ family response regulator
MTRPGVLLADDHTLVLEAFKKLLEAEFDVVGTVTDAGELVSIAPKLKPSVIVLDLGMPGASGMIAGLQLKKLLPRTKLIVLTMNEDPEIAREAMRLWASGYVLKKSGGAELITAIREVLRGKSYLTPSVVRQLEDAFIRDPRPDHKRELTARQREVLQLLGEGLTMRQAADQLHVTTRTVAFHKYRIMEEFGLKTNSDLVRFAIREKVISPA